MQIIFKMQRITDEATQIDYTSTALDSTALHWFINCTSKNMPWMAWAAFQKNLEMSFQLPHFQYHLREQLDELKQMRSVLDYVTKFRNIMEQVEDMGKIDQIRAFMWGVKRNIYIEIKYYLPDSLEDVIKMAINYDTAIFPKEIY